MIQAYPALYSWTTYPLTCLLEKIWSECLPKLHLNERPKVILVELASIMERALNYMHTGNAKVIATSVMNPLWIGRSVIKDGIPCLNKHMIIIRPVDTIIVKADQWPFDEMRQVAKSASQRAQQLTYGDSHFNVSSIICPFCFLPIRPSIYLDPS